MAGFSSINLLRNVNVTAVQVKNATPGYVLLAWIKVQIVQDIKLLI